MTQYISKEHWDAEADNSASGKGDDPGKFSYYKLPPWSRPPQWWEFTQKGMKVLDIGSGIGCDVGKLMERGVFAVSCDISPKLIDIARENCLSRGIHPINFVLWYGLRLPFRNNVFDRITTATVLQHVVDDSILQEMFKEVYRILLPARKKRVKVILLKES